MQHTEQSWSSGRQTPGRRILQEKPSGCVSQFQAASARYRNKGIYSGKNNNSTHVSKMRHSAGPVLHRRLSSGQRTGNRAGVWSGQLRDRQPPLDFGYRRQGGRLPGLEQFGSATEAVPFHCTDVGCQNRVAVLAPDLFVAPLHGLEAPVDHLKHVGGRAVAGLGGQVNRDHPRGAKLAGQRRRDLHAHGAIHQQADSVAHGLKQAGIGAARGDGQENVARVAERRRLPGAQIGGRAHPGECASLRSGSAR
jgi:hypothetical protein